MSVLRDKAIGLRRKGMSVRTIALKLLCAKSSVSVWTRGVKLTAFQKTKLRANQDVGRARAANHPNSPKNKWKNIRQEIINKARREIPEHYDEMALKLVCAGLYWGEGYKKQTNLFVFVNSDPQMIKFMMLFLRKVCHVPEEKFRGGLHIHPSLDIRAAEAFWADLTGIPYRQFHKTHLAVSRASKGVRKILPLGTFRIIISDVSLRSRIQGWLDGVSYWTNSSAG